MKGLFQLMLQGTNGRLQKDLQSHTRKKLSKFVASSKLKLDPKKDEKIDKHKKLIQFRYLSSALADSEERLALWLPLSHDEKLKMIAA